MMMTNAGREGGVHAESGNSPLKCNQPLLQIRFHPHPHDDHDYGHDHDHDPNDDVDDKDDEGTFADGSARADKVWTPSYSRGFRMLWEKKAQR